MSEQKRPRVMIADDEAHCRALLKAILTSMNCEVVAEASNGEQAVQMFKSTRPHLLLLDINMPLKTGDEALAEILAEHPRAFIIVLTSVTDAGSVDKCIGMGAANYIRKDTPVQEIKAIIRDTWRTFAELRSVGAAKEKRGASDGTGVGSQTPGNTLGKPAG